MLSCFNQPQGNMCDPKTIYLPNDLEKVASSFRVSKELNRISNVARWQHIKNPEVPLKTIDAQALAPYYRQSESLVGGLCIGICGKFPRRFWYAAEAEKHRVLLKASRGWHIWQAGIDLGDLGVGLEALEYKREGYLEGDAHGPCPAILPLCRWQIKKLKN